MYDHAMLYGYQIVTSVEKTVISTHTNVRRAQINRRSYSKTEPLGRNHDRVTFFHLTCFLRIHLDESRASDFKSILDQSKPETVGSYIGKMIHTVRGAKEGLAANPRPPAKDTISAR